MSYCLGGMDNDGVTVEQAMEGHEDHDVIHATAGAPGTGNCIICRTCNHKELWSTIRVLEPWEVE